MISKLISHAPTRPKAIEELREVLDYAKIIGIHSNLDFLLNLISHQKFKKFQIDTGFIGANMSTLSPADLSSHPKAYAIAAIATLNHGAGKERRLARYAGEGLSPWQKRNAWRLNQKSNYSISFSGKDDVVDVKIISISENGYTVEVDQISYRLSNGFLDEPLKSPIETILNFVGVWDDTITQNEVILRGAGRTLRISRINSNSDGNASVGNSITAPMPGKIIALNCAAGDSVSEGEALVVMEAMKMEQTLTAPRDGVVAEIGAEVGELVTDGALLVRLEDAK
jgi:acetyl/propionyl-CoA carboxylase alpha subunit